MSGNSFQKLFRLDGKVAVVTGGMGILGHHFCRGLAASGADVAIIDKPSLELETIGASLNNEFGIRAQGIACDIANPAYVNEMTLQVLDQFGKIDILHNNAATKTDDPRSFFTPTEEYRLEDWRKVMSVNIDGMFLVAQSVGKAMIHLKQGGSIIQTSSIYGCMAPDQRIYEGSNYLGGSINSPAVYSASKAAVIGLTKYLATLWAEKGIRVNTLVPGGVESGQNETFTKKYSNRVPLGRMARADEMVGTLIYLASDASSYVTGQTLMVDGGLSAW